MSRERDTTKAITGGRCNDLVVWPAGSVYLIKPLTPEGREWIFSTAPPDAQFMGEAMAVEARYVDNVIAVAREHGLEIA